MSARRPIHQLVHTLSYGDAISTEVLALQRVLQTLGYESEIFAMGEHSRLRGRSRKFAEVMSCGEADLILHYSLGSPLNDIYAGWQRGRRTLVYHNITPAKWFEGLNPRVARDIEQGLAQLPVLCRLSDNLWADSPFNADELRAFGFQVDVLDLPVDPERWDRPRNEEIYKVVKNANAINILHVGRLAPNKCIEDILKSFYFLHHYIEKDSRLWLVGIDVDTELYSFALRDMATQLGIVHNVEFSGCLPDEGVRSMYEACNAYICMSEHEGFCLPIVEAMHFGLPVVAFGAGAVPDTVGDGGVVVYEKRHAAIAEVLYDLATPTPLRGQCIESGKRRVQEFSYQRFLARVSELVSQESSPRRVSAV